MKRIASAAAIAALCAVPLLAQQSETKTTTKVEVHNGEKVTVSGCVIQRGDNLMIRDVSGDVGHSYLLVGKSDELTKHIGHRVEISGKAADRKDGKVVTETKTKTDDDKEQQTKTVSKGDLSIPVLGVEHVKRIAGVCD